MKKKIVIKILFAFVILFGISIKVNAYQSVQNTYITSAGFSYSNFFDNTYNPATNDLTSISYYESFFNYLKTGLTYNNANENISNWANNLITDFADYPYIIVGRSITNFNNSSSTKKYLFWFSKSAPLNNNNVNFRSQQPDILYTWLELDSSNNITWVQSKYYYGTGNSYASIYGSNYYITDNLESIMSTLTYDLIQSQVISNIYDPNYLNNNSNFNRVCLNNQNTYFSIIPNNIDTSTDFINNDFMLLNKFLASGGRTILTLTDINTNIITSGTPSDIDWYYNLWSTEYMNSLNTDTNIINFKQKYNFYNNLYGWSIFPNTFSYNKNLNQFSIPVFVLQNSYTYSVDCVPQTVGGSTVCVYDDSVHGGGGRNHDNDIDTITENTCFYIPNTHYVKVWELNEFNDICDDTININGTDYDVCTDDFENQYLDNINSNNYSGFIGYFKTMLQRLSVPIIFINSKISLLFSKLPQDIQYMIIGLVAFGFLIGLIRFLTGGK